MLTNFSSPIYQFVHCFVINLRFPKLTALIIPMDGQLWEVLLYTLFILQEFADGISISASIKKWL